MGVLDVVGNNYRPARAFQGIFNNARGETYYKWLSLVPIPPPAKRLDAVCVMANRHCEWIPILVPLNTASQKRGYEGGRHLDLPPATLVAAPQHGHRLC